MKRNSPNSSSRYSLTSIPDPMATDPHTPTEPVTVPFTPEDESWQAHRWSEAQKVPERIEDAAKFLATMLSLSLSIMLGLEKPALAIKDYGPSHQLLWGLGFWLVAILVTFMAIMPTSYFSIPDSTDDYRRMHKQIVRRKFGFLLVGAFLFLLGFVTFFLRLVM